MKITKIGFITLSIIISSTTAYSQKYTVQLWPYDEELVEQINYYVQNEEIEFVKQAERNEYYLGRLVWEESSHFAFMSPSNRSYDRSDFELEEESTEPSDIPYQTKRHRMRQLRQDEGLPVDQQGNIVDEAELDTDVQNLQVNSAEREVDLDDETPSVDTVSEKMSTKEQIDEEDKPGFFSRLFGGGKDKKVGKKNPPNDGGRVVISKPEPRLSNSVLDENPETKGVLTEQDKIGNNVVQQGTPSDALVPRKPGAEYDETIINLQDTDNYGYDDDRGIWGRVVDTLTIPFRDSGGEGGNRVHTITAEYTFPTGQEMSLPEVKTRDDDEMYHLFAQLAARTAEWLKADNKEMIRALNSSVSIRTVQDLYYKFERAEVDPYWDQPTKRNQIDTIKSTTNQ